jgi:hypothetical protein
MKLHIREDYDETAKKENNSLITFFHRVIVLINHVSQRLFILERPTTFLEIEFVIPTDVYMDIFSLGEVVRFDALRTAECPHTPYGSHFIDVSS